MDPGERYDKTCRVMIEGVRPGLLMFRMGDYPRDASPEREAESRVYRLATGELFVPARHMVSNIIRAARFFGLGREAYRHVQVVPCALGLGVKEFEVHTRCIRLGPHGRKALLHYPLLREWSLTFEALFTGEIFSPDLMKKILDIAGRRKGTGHDPRYNHFKVISFEEVGEEKLGRG